MADTASGREAGRTRDAVAAYYGQVLTRSEDLATDACCASGPPPPLVAEALANVHERVLERFYGCGFPIPEEVEGATVLDLGCGTGRDVYLLSQLVGEKGFVHGVDMTEAQLRVARETAEWHARRFGYARPNVAFHHGFIEELDALPIEPGSLDLVVSNCVVNLSPDKPRVLREAWRLLRPGGELHLSDVLVDRRLPAEVACDERLHAECLGGALYRNDFLDAAREAGFLDPRIVDEQPITIRDAGIRLRVGEARFSSVTLRLFKLPGLEPRCEDYGQVATYLGGIPGHEALLRLDDHHLFERGRPERVCGNTAAMLEETRFALRFEVRGDRSVHFGEFPCGETLAARGRPGRTAAGDGGGCC